MARELKLPTYAKHLGNGRIEVDAAAFYPAWLAELGIAEDDVDQYWLTVAKACSRFEVEACVAGTEIVPGNGARVLLVQDNTKEVLDGVLLSKYALARYAPGKGEVQGALDAPEHYRRLRGGV